MIVTEGMKKVSEALITIREQYGKSIIEDVSRLRALLSDFCPQQKQETRVLTYVISDEELMRRMISDNNMTIDEAIQITEKKTGITRQWAFDISYCIFNYFEREIGEKITASTGYGEYSAGVNIDQIHNPVDFLRAVSAASDCVVKQSEAFSGSKDIEKICQILGGEKGAFIAEMIKQGAPAYVKAGLWTSTELNNVNGIQINRGFLSPYFATTDDSSMAVLEYPKIFITGNKLLDIPEILPLLEKIVTENQQLLIIADDFGEELLKTLVINKQRGTFSVAAVRAPGYGDRRKEMLKDIAIVTGGFVFPSTPGQTIEDITIDMLGRADEARITKEDTIISYAKGSDDIIRERLAFIKDEYEKSNSDFDKEKLMERYNAISKGITVLNVGGTSESEILKSTEEYSEIYNKAQAAIKDGLPENMNSFIESSIVQLDNMLTSASNDEKAGIEMVKGIIQSMKAME